MESTRFTAGSRSLKTACSRPEGGHRDVRALGGETEDDRSMPTRFAIALRCDSAGVLHGSTAIRERRRTLRLRNLLGSADVQMTNKTSMAVMEAVVSYTSSGCTRPATSAELLVDDPILMKQFRCCDLCRETVVAAENRKCVVRSLERDRADGSCGGLRPSCRGAITALTGPLEGG